MLVQSILGLFSPSNKNRHSSSSPSKLDKKKQPDQPKHNQNDDEVLVIRLRDNTLDGNEQSNSTDIPSSSKVPLRPQRSDDSCRHHLDPERKAPSSGYRLRSILSSLSSSKPLTHQSTHSKRRTQVKISLASQNDFINRRSNVDLNTPSHSFSPSATFSLSKTLSNTFSKSLNLHPSATAITTNSNKSRQGKKKQALIFRNFNSPSTLPISRNHKLKGINKFVARADDRRRPDSSVDSRKDLTRNGLNGRGVVIKQKNRIYEGKNSKPSLKILESNPTELTVKLNQPTKMNPSHHLDTLTRSLITPITSHHFYSQHFSGFQHISNNSEYSSDSVLIIDTEEYHSARSRAEFDKEQLDFNDAQPPELGHVKLDQ